MSNLFFPIDNGRAAWGSTITPAWSVEEQKTASGRRRTLCQQSYPSWVISLSFNDLTKAERDNLLGFYAQCKGSFRSFYYKDFTDHKVTGRTLGKNSDGTYQCVIPFNGYVEPAEYVDNLTVYVDGVKQTSGYTVSGGKITLSTTGVVTADYDYYWKVCFGDSMSFTEVFNDLYKASVKLEVVRE